MHQDRENTSVNLSNDLVRIGDNDSSISGEFTEFKGERYYVINNVDKMPAFFISLVSDSDHWLFISSNGGLTAGRVSPNSALFPYVTVDKIHENTSHTGSKTLLRVHQGSTFEEWEPFNMEHDGRFQLSRKLYKNVLGNKLCFEEVNHDLQLVFRYTWMSSDSYGFIRDCELINLANQTISIDMIDGLQNIYLQVLLVHSRLAQVIWWMPISGMSLIKLPGSLFLRLIQALLIGLIHVSLYGQIQFSVWGLMTIKCCYLHSSSIISVLVIPCNRRHILGVFVAHIWLIQH